MSKENKFLYTILIILWIVFIVEMRFGMKNVLTKESGIIGLFAVFSHRDIIHLLFNSAFIYFMIKGEYNSFINITDLVILTSMAWITSNIVSLIFYPTGTLGLSGIIYAYCGYFAVIDLKNKNFNTLPLAIITVGIIFDIIGVLSKKQGIAYLVHIFGALIGVSMYYVLNTRKQ
jgi:membrane associated rhomboid family serine protease